MLESLQEFWYMWLVLLVLIALAVWAGTKASKAVKSHNEAMRKQQQEMQRDQFLFHKYKELDSRLANESDAAEVAQGVTVVLQRQLEKSNAPDDAFQCAEKWRREVYALFYFDEDCTQSLSFFFQHNEKPLPQEALDGLDSIGEKKLRFFAGSMAAMYDENNEAVSLDPDRVRELNEKFSAVYDKDQFFENVKKYVIKNL